MRFSRRNFLKTLGASSAFATLPRGLAFPTFGPSEKANGLAADLANDPLRPQFHLLPARNWMNDPDGPIFWKGKYHMFFQYNPGAAVWGDMHWAHSISPDMIHWKHMPVALAPTPGSADQDGCFTGSAVDDDGTATFIYTGVRSVSPEEATLRDGAHNFLEVQCLATSRDNDLRNWKKLPAPVLKPPRDPDITGFRDPCLWRDGKTWFMGVGSGQKHQGGRVLLYRSADLRHWEYLHPLASGRWSGKESNNPVDSGEMWECPDFFPLGKKHVLLYSTEGKVCWEVGELDAKEMVFHSEKRGLLDHGAYYAPKSQLDAKGRRILWGWIPETRPEAEFSAAGWAGCMSLPRVLSIDADGGLKMSVIPEIAQLRGNEVSFSPATEGVDALRKIALKAACAEIEIRMVTKKLSLRLTDGNQDIFAVSYDPEKTGSEWEVNGRSAPLVTHSAEGTRLHIFLDGSVVEAIADDSVALTTRAYTPLHGNLRFEVSDADFGAIRSVRVWPLRPISSDRLTS